MTNFYEQEQSLYRNEKVHSHEHKETLTTNNHVKEAEKVTYSHIVCLNIYFRCLFNHFLLCNNIYASYFMTFGK